MTSEDGKESKSPEEDGKVLLIEENSKIFYFFKFFGLYLICYDSDTKKYRMSERLHILSRFFWFLFHLGGVIFGMYLKIYVEQSSTLTAALAGENSTDVINNFLMTSILVFVFIICDPIQTIILRRSLEILPDLLNNEVKHLKNLTKEKFGNVPRRVGLFPWEKQKIMKSFTVEDGVDSKSENTSKCNNICKWNIRKFRKVVGIGYLTILFVAFLILFSYGFWYEANWKEIPKDSALVVLCFYLVFPMFSTWFCVVFIEYERQLYKLIDNHITDEDFVDENKIKHISDYLKTMQVLFRKITEKFFKFVFGMNSMIFVISGIYCMFELLDGYDNARKSTSNDKTFHTLFYAIPLALTIFHIFIICKASNSLISGQHTKLCIRLMRLMTSLLMEGNDKPMKKIEMLYKNLKDWPPQAEIYGGYKINYQILTGMIIFIISYARIFTGIFKEDLTTAPAPTTWADTTTLVNITTLAPTT